MPYNPGLNTSTSLQTQVCHDLVHTSISHCMRALLMTTPGSCSRERQVIHRSEMLAERAGRANGSQKEGGKHSESRYTGGARISGVPYGPIRRAERQFSRSGARCRTRHYHELVAPIDHTCQVDRHAQMLFVQSDLLCRRPSRRALRHKTRGESPRNNRTATHGVGPLVELQAGPMKDVSSLPATRTGCDSRYTPIARQVRFE